MRIAVIIVNYNDIDDTIQYVKKLTKYENINRIVIVDNLSTQPDTMKMLKMLEDDKVSAIQSDKNGGYSYGNNFGVRFLESQNEKYDYLIISNPDVEIEKKAIDRCIEVLENDEMVAICAPRMYNSSYAPIRRSAWKIRTFALDAIHSTRLLEILFYKKLRGRRIF